jgi:membrane fusion protein
MINKPLFRPEVLAERQTQWLGTVVLTPKLSYRLFALFAAVTSIAILWLLFFADYTRKERVNGWLVPQYGLVQVFAPQPGVVTEIYIKEGAEVKKGERLIAISAELQSTTLGATQTEIAQRLSARRSSLLKDRQQLGKLGTQQLQSLTDRLKELVLEQSQLKGEIALQRSRTRLAEKSEERSQKLHQQSIISDEQLQTAEAARLEQDSKLQALERMRITTERERLTLEGELRDLPIKTAAEIAGIERNIAQVEQELAEAEARREIAVLAPTAGTITTMLAERGSRPNSTMPLLGIVPAGSKLEAQLFSPSRAIGFLQLGQRVLLRYQAYPYQKFGHYEGRITNISRSAINPGELPAQLAGLTSLFVSTEPVYRITVSLTEQAVTAYGKPVPLQPGMQLEADILIETRRLIEWVLDPLYTLTGR